MATQKILDKRVEELTEKYLGKVRASGIKLTKALIFGSHSAGLADRHSDIDLAVISPDFGKDHHEELVTLFKLVDVETRELEPIPLSPQGLEDRYDPLATEVRQHGITIYP